MGNFRGTRVNLIINSGLIVNNNSLGLFSGGIIGTAHIKGGQIINTGRIIDSSSSRPLDLNIEGGQFVNHGTFGNYRFIGTVAEPLEPAGAVYFSGGSISNTGNFIQGINAIAASASLASCRISGSAFALNSGIMASGLGTLTIMGGTIINNGTSASSLNLFATNNSSTLLEGSGYISNGPFSYMGPTPLEMNGGVLINNGTMILARVEGAGSSFEIKESESNLIAGTISGSGTMYVASNMQATISFIQDKIIVGEVFYPMYNRYEEASGELGVFGSLQADVTNKALGVFGGLGTLQGNLYSFGRLQLGVNQANVENEIIYKNFYIQKDATLDASSGSSSYFVFFDGNGSNKLFCDGTFSLFGTMNTLLIYGTGSNVASSKEYTLVEAKSVVGQFGTVQYYQEEGLYLFTSDLPPLSNIQLVYNTKSNPNTIKMRVNYTPGLLSLEGNPGQIVEVFEQIDGNCPGPTQLIINQAKDSSPSGQYEICSESCPAFKIIQFSLEKLDLLLHKELEESLYSNQDKNEVFTLFGYDNLDQGPGGSYNGYSVDSYYQLLAASGKWLGARWLGSIGASESYIKARPQDAKANYNTLWLAFGGSRASSRWSYGLDALYSYSFIHARRHVGYLNATAKTSHGAWNLSFDAKIAYDNKNPIIATQIYDDVSYIYGSEHSYHESGAPGANLKVKDETISQIRNMLGFVFQTQKGHYVNLFADASWVYEHYFNQNIFYGAFLGTDVYGSFRQKRPPENYGRIHTGLKGSYKEFEWKIAYTGLYSYNFSESSASIKLGYKF